MENNLQPRRTCHPAQRPCRPAQLFFSPAQVSAHLCHPARMCSFDNFEKSALLNLLECEIGLDFNWKVVDL